MSVAQTTIEGLSQLLTVTVTKESYLPEWKKQLSKRQKTAQLKGFRPGKTPMGFIKKMYGQSLLGEAINLKVQEELNTHIKENDLRLIGDPRLSADQDLIDFDIKNPTNYTFNFEIGLAPKIELDNLSAITVPKYSIEITEDMIDEEITSAQKRVGQKEEVEEASDLEDLITLSAKELNADGEILKDGYEVEIEVLISMMNEEAQPLFLNHKLNDEIKFNAYNLEKDTSREFVQNHILAIPDDRLHEEIGEEFIGTIIKIQRNVPAELNEEFFKTLFNDDAITDEAGAREKYKEILAGHYDKNTNDLLHIELKTALLDSLEIQLPDVFIERWIKEAEKGITPEELDNLKLQESENLTWYLIKREVTEQHNIQISREDIRDVFRTQFMSYLGGQIPMHQEALENIIDKMMTDEKQVNKIHEQLIEKRVVDELTEQVTLVESTMSVGEYEEKVESINERYK